MKKLFLIFFSITCFGQAPAIEWQKTYGGSQYDYPTSIIKTNDGGYIIVGATSSSDQDITLYHGGARDWWVLKLDNIGEIEWQKTYGGPNDEIAYAIKSTSDGGYIITGYTGSNEGDVTVNNGLNDIWVVKIDTNGNIEWEKSFGGSNYEVAGDIIECSNGGYMLCGMTRSHDDDAILNPNGFDFNAYILKINAIGIIEWQKFYGGTADDSLSKIQEVNGDFVLSGMTASNDINVSGNHGGFDYWIVKIDAFGTLIWQKTIGGALNDSATDIKKTSDGGFIVCGYTYSTNGDITGNHGDDDAWVVKLNADGDMIWQKAFGGSNTDRAYAIIQSSDNGYILSGYTLSNNGDVISSHFGYEGWVLKMNDIGVIQWNKTLGGSMSDETSSIVETTEGGYVIAGNTESSNGDVTLNHGSGDLWIIKLYTDLLSSSNIDKDAFSIYPNPATSAINIQFSNEITIDKIIITDILGKNILQQNQGTNQLDIENLSSGIYFIEVTANNRTYQTKFIKQ